MIASMTGYGKATAVVNGYEASVEVRSLNHRFLDVSVKLPKSVETKENLVRDLVRQHFERGRITVNVTLREEAGNPVGLVLNEEAVDGYKQLLQALRAKVDITAPVAIDHFLTFSDIFTQVNDAEVPETAWEALRGALGAALQELNAMREREGEEIKKDLLKRLSLITRYVQKIEALSQGRSKTEFDKLYKRLRSMLEVGELDASRLELEVALLADRVDVTEECIRLKSHSTVFDESINQPEPAGRKLNFLLQEMNREANTIGAKASDAEIAHIVVQIKEEVEKLREQVQNIE